MPIQPINYLNAPIVKSPWEQDFAKLLGQGMALRHEPQRLMREKEKELLANALQKEKVGQAQAETPWHGQLSEANAKIKTAMASRPFAGTLGGDVGQAVDLAYLEAIGYPGAKDAREMRTSQLESRVETTRLKDKNASTINQKLRKEDKEIDADPYMSQEEKTEAKALNKAQREKVARTGPMIDRIVSGEITEEGIKKLLEPNVKKALTQYSGAQGHGMWLADKAAAAISGKSPQRLLDYADAVSTAKNTANNLRIAIKESVSPAKAEEILSLLDSTDWSTQPDEAIAALESTAKFFADEMRIIRKHSGVVEPKSKQENMAVVKKQAQEAKSQNIQPAKKTEKGPIKRYKMINGAWTLV